MSRERSNKRQLEKARLDKAADKRAKRHDRSQAESDVGEVAVEPQEVVLAELATLHQRFSDGLMSFDDFEAARDELVDRVHID